MVTQAEMQIILTVIDGFIILVMCQMKSNLRKSTPIKAVGCYVSSAEFIALFWS